MTFPRQTLLNRTKVAASTLLTLRAVGGILTAPPAYADDDPLDFVLDFETLMPGATLSMPITLTPMVPTAPHGYWFALERPGHHH
jgi:hypothetical protein